MNGTDETTEPSGARSIDGITSAMQTEIEAAVLRRLIAHFQASTNVQNIDVMNIAGFCRNCLSKWMFAAAEEAGAEVEFETVREHVYGMPYSRWKAEFQK